MIFALMDVNGRKHRSIDAWEPFADAEAVNTPGRIPLCAT